MDRNEFIDTMNKHIKLIRTEYNLPQDKMAVALGISKKTLVEIEKGRISLSWSAAVTAATIFSDSEVLQNCFGGETSDLIRALALDDIDGSYRITHGGRVWWQNVEEKGGYVIQQNMISTHYRILDIEKRKYYSSFSLTDTEKKLEEILRRKDI